MNTTVVTANTGFAGRIIYVSLKEKFDLQDSFFVYQKVMELRSKTPESQSETI